MNPYEGNLTIGAVEIAVYPASAEKRLKDFNPMEEALVLQAAALVGHQYHQRDLGFYAALRIEAENRLREKANMEALKAEPRKAWR